MPESSTSQVSAIWGSLRGSLRVGGTLKRSLARIYNGLGQMQVLSDALATPSDFTYDLNGNVDTVKDALNRVSDNDYDPLGRLKTSTVNATGVSPDKATTQFQYDARDNLTTVIDPKGLSTVYAYDDLDDLKTLTSPDTGITNYAYDTAGNRISQVDARGTSTSYVYDVLNRLTSQSVPTATQSVTFEYDTPFADCPRGETFGTGRLSRITDESGSTRYCYNLLGQLVRKVQEVTSGPVLTVGTTYNSADRLVAMTYPSGAIVSYLRDANGQITGISAKPTATAAQVTLVSGVTYLPFGPLNTLTFGNGRVVTKAYDQNYGIDKVSDAATGGISEDFTLDVVGNVTGLVERTTATANTTRGFTYDGQDRLTALKNGTTVVQGFTYDATGNRLSKNLSGTITTNTIAPTSHRLTQTGTTVLTYDANGNQTKNGTPAFVYDDRNRLRDYKANGTALTRTYRYNGKGERVSKTVAAGDTNNRYYTYDESGHLLGEYLASGVRVQEYVWMDDTLVAVLSDHDATTYQYVQTDHLGTPRAVINPVSNAIIWRWNLTNTAFGEHAPVADPDGNTISYTFNMRYPGQWYDSESKLHYNYFRDYDPANGRYVESDPIGLAGGFNTYGYVSADPLVMSDPSGLFATVCKKGNKLYISMPILFKTRKGVGSIGDLVAAAEAGWTGKIGDYDVSLDIIPWGNNAFGIDMPTVEVQSGGYDDTSWGGEVWNAALWYTSPAERHTVVHEVSHLLLARDYNMRDASRSILADPQGPNGTYGPKVFPEDIKSLLDGNRAVKFLGPDCGCDKVW
jgi:RHS repeat-associated protein